MGSRTSKEVALGAKDLSSQALSDDVRQVVIQANLHFGERHQGADDRTGLRKFNYLKVTTQV